jgi:putative addiction module component (TIGR02574 family)
VRPFGISSGIWYNDGMSLCDLRGADEGEIEMTVAIAEIAQMSVTERVQLVEDIWDTVANDLNELPLTEAQVAELDRRLDDLDRNPDAGSTWEEVKMRIQGRK